MNVVALVESVNHVCVRYRLAAYRDALAAAGHTLAFEPLAMSLFGRLKQYETMSRYEAVILQRTLLSPFELTMLRRNATRLVFDFDDAIWLRDSYAPHGLHSTKRLRRFRNMIQHADCLIAGNEFLAANAPGAIVIPTCVPKGTPIAMRGSDALTLVWIGSSSTLKSLEQFRPTLSAIGHTFANIRLKLICDRFADFEPLHVEKVTWNAATESNDVASSHIGLAVMPDDDWSRGKCGVKVLQYLAAGLPVVANPVGIHSTMVPDNGILASTTGEWIEAIRQLHDPDLRQRLGDHGRQFVENHYSVAVGTRAWIRLLESFSRRLAC